MRSIWIPKHGDARVLEVRETADPEPEPGQVRVRARACGLNFAEISARQGLYPDAPKPPCVVGYEGAGVVDAVGEGVREGLDCPAVGSRVIYLSRFWGHADTVCVPAAQVVPLPDDWTFEEGAAMPVNYITAYHMLFRVARIRPGDTLLIHMAAGGVGTALLQLQQTVRDIVTYGTASAKKHDYVRSHGCTHPIDYRSVDYVEAIRDLTDGRGVDYIFDALGGRDWKKGYELLRPAGMLVLFGMANTNVGGKRSLLRALSVVTQVPWWSGMKLLNDNKGVAGVNIGHLWQEIAMLREEMDALLDLAKQGVIRPHIHKAYSFDDVREAHEALEYGHNLGKIVLLP